jgi:hypothetical protein
MAKTRLIYHTPDNLLPPASFEVMAEIEPANDGLQVRLNQTFNNREEIPKEEIEAEGFSESDDFFWEGKLPKIWAKEWENIFPTKDVEPTHSGHRIAFSLGGEKELMSPKNEEDL